MQSTVRIRRAIPTVSIFYSQPPYSRHAAWGSGLSLFQPLCRCQSNLPLSTSACRSGARPQASLSGVAFSSCNSLSNLGVLGATGIITVFAMRYITAKMNSVKASVIHARRKARGEYRLYLVSIDSVPSILVPSFPPRLDQAHDASKQNTLPDGSAQTLHGKSLWTSSNI